MKPGWTKFAYALPFLTLSPPLLAQESPAETARLIGDIGVGANIAPTIARSSTSNTSAVPYANFDYGRLFARIDTFGVRLVPAGYGSLELVARYIGDGYTPLPTAQGGLDRRKSSLPIGLGTLQTTPLGAVFLNAFHDANKSGGNLVDLIYAAEFDTGPFALYPQAGAEYRSSAYVRYFYGVSAAESARSGLAVYQPRDAVNTFVGLFIEAKVSGHWYVNANLRRTWLNNTISASPLVARHASNSALLSLSYRFE
ncbi:MipA/OmpV family protein [Undibacterium sp. TJN25]|uniref:MipA/OmpV family protein n=1 Tax=Undibacterium sp. TJN25 TaxID=3413056 RepID=UPI003BF3F1C0